MNKGVEKRHSILLKWKPVWIEICIEYLNLIAKSELIDCMPPVLPTFSQINKII